MGIKCLTRAFAGMQKRTWPVGLVLILLVACGVARPIVKPVAPLNLTYLGVAGWQIESDGVVILVDPYFSRPDLDRPVASDPAAVARRSPRRADLILVGHSHIDHLLDAPAVARATGAELLGSESTTRFARANGVADDRLITVKGGEDYAFERFSVRVLPSLHSGIGNKHAKPASFAAEAALPLAVDAFAEGGTFAYLVRVGGHELALVTTANFIERELEGLRPDLAVIAIGARREVHDYTCRILRALGHPPLVFPTHADDWRAPAEGQPRDPDIDQFIAEVARCSPRTRVVVATPFRPLAL
jgi:L-ascorbate metabolism protein UlaG (beta-lactamase superfamily)